MSYKEKQEISELESGKCQKRSFYLKSSQTYIFIPTIFIIRAKLFNKKRNVLFIVPCDKYFRTAFTFGDKATEIVFNSELPKKIKKELFETEKYAEGRTIQIDVKNENDLKSIFSLIQIKLTN